MPRKFGKIVTKPSKSKAKWLEASYITPKDAFDKWPGLSERQTKTFSLGEEDDAAAWLGRQRKLIDAGVWKPTFVVKHDEKAARLTLGEYFPEWLEQRTYKGRPLKAGTRYRLRKDGENHILPYFGNTRLIDITQHDLDAWLATLPSDQEAMRANSLKVLKAVLRTASQPGEHGQPPLIPQYPCTRSLLRPRRRNETIPATPEQVKAIHDAMPRRYAMAVYLAVFGDGLRIGEVCALQRRDIDLAECTMHIRRGRVTADSTKLVDTPKTESSIRDERIPSQLVPLIRSFLDNDVDQDDVAWLFPAKTDASRPIHPNTLRGDYEKARIKAGRPDLRFHDLRHTGLTWLAEDGATVRELMDAAGHSDVETAMRYQHSVSERRVVLAERLGVRLLPDDTVEIVGERIRQLDARIAELEGLRDVERAKLERLKGVRA
ncbi:site-specific integrase [Bifidobacterium mongoliense]|uniref:tyrosine-type recombinase/integrase n=1 Tax=Bifidobacterium mongoliense TaxID=518643 RepID=UPI0030F3ABA8